MHLRDYIETRKFAYKEFAEKIGISPQALSNYLKGIRQVPLHTAIKIEEFTNKKVTVEELLKMVNKQ